VESQSDFPPESRYAGFERTPLERVQTESMDHDAKRICNETQDPQPMTAMTV
jgi:hypothetical protein